MTRRPGGRRCIVLICTTTLPFEGSLRVCLVCSEAEKSTLKRGLKYRTFAARHATASVFGICSPYRKEPHGPARVPQSLMLITHDPGRHDEAGLRVAVGQFGNIIDHHLTGPEVEDFIDAIHQEKRVAAL